MKSVTFCRDSKRIVKIVVSLQELQNLHKIFSTKYMAAEQVKYCYEICLIEDSSQVYSYSHLTNVGLACMHVYDVESNTNNIVDIFGFLM